MLKGKKTVLGFLPVLPNWVRYIFHRRRLRDFSAVILPANFRPDQPVLEVGQSERQDRKVFGRSTGFSRNLPESY
jgi:hypothetical protein